MRVNIMHEMTRRRRSFLKTVGAASAAGVVALAGCSDGGGDGGGGGGQTQFTYAGSENGTAPYQIGLTWANEIQSNTDYELSVQTTGGFNASQRQVGSGAIDMGAGSTPDFQAADMGHPPFENQFDTNILFTCAAYPFPIAFTTGDTDIDFLKDTGGKRVVTGLPGSTVHTYYRLFMLANGYGWEETEPVRVGSEEGFQNLQDGQVSAVITAGLNNIIGPQAQQFIQTADQPQLVVPDGREPIDRLINAKDYVDNWNITGGVEWEFNIEGLGPAYENSVYSDRSSYATVAGTNTHFTTLDVRDEVIREIVTVAIENRQTLAEGTGLWAGFAQAPEQFATLITDADAEAAPFHPGAVEALRENDLWDDSLPVAER
ncbi:MAG: TAXI family TRAP transporter solute-binding subunit [Halolamina sp.]